MADTALTQSSPASTTAPVQSAASGPGTQPPSRLGRRLSSGAQRLWLLVALAGVWEVVGRWRQSFFVPPLSTILDAFADTWLSGDPGRLFVSERFVEHALPSLGRFAAGWGLAALLGVTLGLVLGRSATLSAALDPLVRFGMATPAPALLPFAIVMFGIGNGAKVFLITLGTVWPVLLNTIDGVRSIDPVMLNTSRVLRLRPRRFVTTVLLPAAAPQILAGMRVSLATGLILMIISELYASTQGIGFVIQNAQRSFLIPEMWAGIVLLALIGLVVNAAYLQVERRLLGWHHAQRTSHR